MSPYVYDRITDPLPTPIKQCRPRKPHRCRICGDWIKAGELCDRWSGVTYGEGWWTCHAHPECYDQTIREKWDEGDWESGYWEHDFTRPLQKRTCVECGKESDQWIRLMPCPTYVCSTDCFIKHYQKNEDHCSPSGPLPQADASGHV